MPIAQFCEREYESNFNLQVPKLNAPIWSPGQIQEHVLGFDAAFLSHSPLIFRIASHRLHHPDGVFVSPASWQQYFDIASHHLPPSIFNLFVQHKRPEYIGSPLGKERNYWLGPYYRYGIDKQQQLCLEKLETLAGNDALVTYACAAFHTSQQLWDHAVQSTLIQSSNFVRPAALIDHDRYSFDKPGGSGWATSEPAVVEGTAFSERFAEHLDSRNEHTLGEIIKKAAKIVREAMYTPGVSGQLFEQVLTDVSGGELDEDSVLHSYITVQAFCFVNRTSWSIVMQP